MTLLVAMSLKINIEIYDLHFRYRNMAKKNRLKFREENSDLFQVQSRVDNRRKKKNFVKPGWADQLMKLIWNKLKLPCAFQLKSAMVRVKTREVVSTGKCKDCSAKVSAHFCMDTKVLKVSVRKYKKDVEHKSTRYVSGELKTRLDDMLTGSSAYAVRSKLANEEMEDGNKKPPSIPSNGALRARKFRQITTQDRDPVIALQILKKGKFKNDIQRIGCDPFFVFYAHHLQILWYESKSKMRWNSVAIDATGIGLRKMNSAKPKALLLYSMVLQGIAMDNLLLSSIYLTNVHSIRF